MNSKDEKPERINFVTVYKTGDPAFISFAKSLLESEGIIYYFKGEGLQNLEGAGSIGTGFNQLFGPVEIQVDEKDAQKAKEILEKSEQSKFDMPEYTYSDEKDAENESKGNNKASFKGIFAGIIIGIIIAIVIHYIYNVEKYRQSNLSWVDKLDTNKDGSPDLFYNYQNGVLVKIESDKNFDGKIDQRCLFKNDMQEYCESDENYDRVFERKSYFKSGVLSREEIDVNNDKKPDNYLSYIDGVIYDEKIYHELNHKLWDKILYRNGIINEESIDLDGDGKFDTLIKYNEYGRLIEINHITK